MSTEDQDVYLTPSVLLHDKVRVNAMGQVVPKKQPPIIEYETDDQGYTLAVVETRNDEVTKPRNTRIAISNDEKNYVFQ